MAFQTIRARLGAARVHLASLQQDSAAHLSCSLLQCNAVLELLASSSATVPQRATLGLLAAQCQWIPADLTRVMSALAQEPANQQALAAAAATRPAKAARRQLQDYMHWDAYVSNDEWEMLLDKTITVQAKQQLLIEIVVGRLWGINPNEESMKYLASCSIALSNDAAGCMKVKHADKIAHREWVKREWKRRARGDRQPLHYVDKLPANPQQLRGTYPLLHDHIVSQLEGGQFVPSRLPRSLCVQVNNTFSCRGAAEKPSTALAVQESSVANPGRFPGMPTPDMDPSNLMQATHHRSGRLFNFFFV